MNASSLIRKFGKSYCVKRNSKSGSYIEGEWVPTNRVEEIKIIASIQPIKGEELQRLPEAQRTLEARKLFTTTKLMTASEPGGKNADVVVIGCDNWEVSLVSEWDAVLNHFECVILRMNTPNM